MYLNIRRNCFAATVTMPFYDCFATTDGVMWSIVRVARSAYYKRLRMFFSRTRQLTIENSVHGWSFARSGNTVSSQQVNRQVDLWSNTEEDHGKKFDRRFKSHFNNLHLWSRILTVVGLRKQRQRRLLDVDLDLKLKAPSFHWCLTTHRFIAAITMSTETNSE